MGVRWYGKGAYDRGAVTTETVKAKSLFRAHEGDFVFNRIDTQNGAFDVVPSDLDGALATNEFPLYITDPSRLLAHFLLLYFQQESVRAAIDRTRAGSEGRARWKESHFEAWQIPLPPLVEQRRIVDLMASIDQQTAALAQELENSTQTRTAVLDSLLASGDEVWPTEPLGALGTFTRGRRFTKLDYVDSGLGCIHYGQIYTKFGAIARSTFTFLPVEYKERMRLADPGDLIIAATGEDPVAVGKAVAWLGGAAVAVHDDAQIFRHRLDARYAAYVTATTAFQVQKMRLVSDMKVARVSSKDLASIRVPVPPRKAQTRIADAVEALDVKQDAVSRELESLHAFRSALLTALLNQDSAIPASYDRFLEEVE